MPTPDSPNGHVTISRTESSADPYNRMTIWVEHHGVTVKAEVDMYDFAMALTGRSFVPATVTTKGATW